MKLTVVSETGAMPVIVREVNPFAHLGGQVRTFRLKTTEEKIEELAENLADKICREELGQEPSEDNLGFRKVMVHGMVQWNKSALSTQGKFSGGRKVFVAVPVSERMPQVSGYYFVFFTEIADGDCIFFNSNLPNGGWNDEIECWLEEQQGQREYILGETYELDENELIEIK